MRVSKAPEERKREMIDTAMMLFAKKGYEATSMTDIAKEMHVVSGLCYRYFSSKEELYHTALDLYAKECAAPVIAIMEADYDTFEEYTDNFMKNFISTDGKEKYHKFFHGEGNEMFHGELVHSMFKELLPYAICMLERMKEKELIHVDDCEAAAAFILYGQMPIIDSDGMEPEVKAKKALALISKVLK